MLPGCVLLTSFEQTGTLTHNEIMPLNNGGLQLSSTHTVCINHLHTTNICLWYQLINRFADDKW